MTQFFGSHNKEVKPIRIKRNRALVIRQWERTR